MMRYLKRKGRLCVTSKAFGAALCEEIVWSIASRIFMHHFPHQHKLVLAILAELSTSATLIYHFMKVCLFHRL